MSKGESMKPPSLLSVSCVPWRPIGRLGSALRRRWEATVDLHALIGALIFEQARLPEWLFRGLVQKLNEQFNNPYVTRFLAVRRPMTFWA